MERIWTCTFVGESDSMPNGSDGPMREAVAKAFRSMTGNPPVAIFSGWGGTLGERERAVIEDRDPKPEPAKDMECDPKYPEICCDNPDCCPKYRASLPPSPKSGKEGGL